MHYKKKLRAQRRKHPLWRLKAIMRSGRGILLLGPPPDDALSEFEIVYGRLPDDIRIRELARLAHERGCKLEVSVATA